MHACMYVCVCTYVCTYVCMYVYNILMTCSISKVLTCLGFTDSWIHRMYINSIQIQIQIDSHLHIMQNYFAS